VSRSRRVAPVLAVAVALVAVAAMAGFFVTRGAAGTPAASTDTLAGTTSASPGSSAPATEESVQPEAVETDAAAPAANPSSGQTVATDEPAVTDGTDVSVELTSWGWNASKRSAQVRGYAAGVVEDGGTCTLTLSRGERTQSVTSAAFADASTTICGALVVPAGDLAPGAWDAVVTYTADGVSGSSATVEVTVA
jgi:hypothetical protein